MSAPLLTANLFRALLPRDCLNGCLAMLTAYFDDSGTHTGGKHGPSKIVMVAGIVGTEARLGSLERNWKNHIDKPLDGRKERLRRFHAYDCDNSIGEFSGWTRTETDYFCHQLRTVIIEADVAAYGVACIKNDWDALITGDVRAIMGSSEQMCIRNCFVKAIEWAENNTFDPKMTFVFDTRPSEIQRDAQIVSHAYANGRVDNLGRSLVPQIVDTAFLSSYQVAALQAADLIAWELYQFANDIYFKGEKEPKRAQLKHLMNNMHFPAQITSRESIKKIVDHVCSRDPEKVKQVAEHFRTFDPKGGE